MSIGVLVSGRGSNLEAILLAIEDGRVPNARVAVVISNDPNARALDVARNHNVAAVALESRGESRDAYGERLANCLRDKGVLPDSGLVLLAGFMKILPKTFVDLYMNRIMNIHPSLLPSFPGVRAQLQALSYGVKVAGCTVHFVIPEVDAGPIVIQRTVEVLDGDDEDTLSARILEQEHRIYPEAVRLFAEGRLKIEGRRVVASK